MAQAEAPHAPLNAWYAAAWDQRDQVASCFPAPSCGKKMGPCFHREDGRAVRALEDACWHRLVPLSIGKLIGDEVQCGYHGLRFISQALPLHRG